MNYYYEIIIPKDKFMEYAKSIDGSPNTIFAAFMFKMIARYFPAKPDEILSGRIADDYRKDIGANESYRDFTRLLHVMYTREMENDSIFLCFYINRFYSMISFVLCWIIKGGSMY